MNIRPTLALLSALVLAGCATTVQPDGRHRTPTPQRTTLAPTGSQPPIVIAQGHGWNASGLFGPMPAPGSCRIRHAADGEPLPDPHCTPGAIDTAVTDGNIGSTVCRKGGYTSSVRPPQALTDAAKKQLMAAYGLPLSEISGFELDHLVALNDGGASDVRNLWPEPNNTSLYHPSTYIHNDKDAVEDYTYAAICKGTVTVTAVQTAMARDWSTAVATLGLPPTPGNYAGSSE